MAHASAARGSTGTLAMFVWYLDSGTGSTPGPICEHGFARIQVCDSMAVAGASGRASPHSLLYPIAQLEGHSMVGGGHPSALGRARAAGVFSAVQNAPLLAIPPNHTRPATSEELQQAAEAEKEGAKDFKVSVSKLQERVRTARQAAAAKTPSAASSSGAGSEPHRKRAKLAAPRKPVALRVPKSGITAEVLQGLAPDGCHFAESSRNQAWRSWWAGDFSHLGNRQRSWGGHGHVQAGHALLREVWAQYSADTGEVCPLQWD